MHIRKVISLQVVVDIHLPVTIDIVLDPAEEFLARKRRRRYRFQNSTELGGCRCRRFSEVCEYQSLPNFDCHRDEPVILPVKQFYPVEPGYPPQTAVQQIGPAVILALESV